MQDNQYTPLFEFGEIQKFSMLAELANQTTNIQQIVFCVKNQNTQKNFNNVISKICIVVFLCENIYHVS